MTSRDEQQTILIIDDNPTNLKVIVNYLKEHNLNIFIARSGKRGLERAKLARPDLILLDIIMPEMDGFQVCQQLKTLENTQDIPVIFMTAMTDPESKIRGFECGAVDYITKPVQEAEVLARILTHLKLRKLSRNLEQKVNERTQELRQANEELANEIAERKRVEQELRSNEEKFRAIVETSPMGMHMYHLEADGRLVFTGANPAADRILGVDNQQFVGQTIEEAFPPLIETEVPQSYRQVAEKGTTWQHDQIIYEDQQISGAYEVYAFQTSPGRMTAMFLDITARKQAEAEINRLQHLLQNITDSMPSALIALNTEGELLFWNPAAESLTDQTISQVSGQSLWERYPQLKRYQGLFEQVLRERRIAHLHKEAITQGNEQNYRNIDIFPLIANDIEGAVLRIDDVTQRVQLEEMMLQSAKMAGVGGLAAGVAHEINNPLGAMMQSAQMLQLAFDTQRPRTRKLLEKAGVSPEGLETYLQERDIHYYLDGIRTSGERAAKIVTDLLSFSRRSSSQIAPYNLNSLVEQTLELALTDYDLKKKYDVRDIKIVRNFDTNLPQVQCDGQQIQQVVLNLVRNAAQSMAASPEDSRLVITTGLQTRQNTDGGLEQWVRLEIEDNGPGIPEEINERLFEPFFTTKKVGEGTGLGLWLCWSIVVERHHGRIWVESRGDKPGSRFIVELPVNMETSH